MKCSLFILSVLLFCYQGFAIDDQTVVTGERLVEGNPVPSARDFARINAQHKILVGIVDTGIDYNQPLLAENLHFKLDANNQPVGFGHDFTGNDDWASPYVMRTSDLNAQIDPDKKEQSTHEHDNTQKLLAKYPEFASFLSPNRNIFQEVVENAFHGTHVAGLASYDRPEIGVIGYRALPMNEQYKDGEEVPVSIETFADGLVQASEAAIKDGVRVINMSLGNDVDSPIKAIGKAARMFEKQKLNVDKIKQLALAHPDILFVVAAGNDSKWIDEESRLAMPCGVQAPNILCVGALDKNGKIASFSNILVTEGAFIMTYGVEVLSTIPTKICMTPAYQVLGNDNYFSDDLPMEAVAQRLREDCKNLSLLKLNGTSMASPIIARQAAIILEDHPELTGAQVIDALMAKTVETKVGKLPFAKLKIEKPSWYSAEDNDWMNKSDGSLANLPVLGNDYFEFLVPGKK